MCIKSQCRVTVIVFNLNGSVRNSTCPSFVVRYTQLKGCGYPLIKLYLMTLSISISRDLVEIRDSRRNWLHIIFVGRPRMLYLVRLFRSSWPYETLTINLTPVDVAITSIRSQVLGHSRADIYERYYQSQKVMADVQSAYLGTPAREALIRSLGTMSLTRDHNAPKELN